MEPQDDLNTAGVESVKMITWMDLLALYERAHVVIQSLVSSSKAWLQTVVGPQQSAEIWILKNGTIVPDTMELVGNTDQILATYNQKEKRITSVDSSASTQRYVRLPIVSLVLSNGAAQEVDYSDWLGDVRSNVGIGMNAMIRLAASVHGQIVDEADPDIRVHWIDRATGQEYESRYEGGVVLMPVEQ